MAHTVLVAFDGSPLAERALDHALTSMPDAELTAIHVINPVDVIVAVETGGLPVADDWYETAQDQADAIQTVASELAAAHNRTIKTVTEIGRPARTILQYARDNNIDQLVIGSHGRSGINRALLGSVAETVARRARVPVTIVR